MPSFQFKIWEISERPSIYRHSTPRLPVAVDSSVKPQMQNAAQLVEEFDKAHKLTLDEIKMAQEWDSSHEPPVLHNRTTNHFKSTAFDPYSRQLPPAGPIRSNITLYKR